MTARDETKLLIARQIAIFNGVNPNLITTTFKAGYLTLAENILATVERKAVGTIQWDVKVHHHSREDWNET